MKRFVGVYLSDDSGCGMEVRDCFIGESVKEVIDKMIDYEKEINCDEEGEFDFEEMRKELLESRGYSWEDEDWGYSYVYMIREEY